MTLIATASAESGERLSFSRSGLRLGELDAAGAGLGTPPRDAPRGSSVRSATYAAESRGGGRTPAFFIQPRQSIFSTSIPLRNGISATAVAPQSTVLDLLGYVDHAGGLNQVATVLAELAERIDPEKLAEAARTAPVGWAQRLGYLLEHLGFDAKVPALKEYVRRQAKESTVLLPKAPRKRSRRNKGWKLYVNASVTTISIGLSL